MSWEKFNPLNDEEQTIVTIIKGSADLIDMDSIKACLEEHIGDMTGSTSDSWIVKSSGYENELCGLLGWEVKKGRYYDAISRCRKNVEIKKGKSQMHFDEVRYSELFLNPNLPETVTIFLHYEKRKNGSSQVKRIFIIETDNIVKRLQIDSKWANACIERYKFLDEKRLNIQQSLSIKDLEQISNYIIAPSA